MKVAAQQIAPQNRHNRADFKGFAHFKDVLSEFLSDGDRLLLGFSGGDDSLALLHLLQDCPYEVHLAHFDHGWRESSAAEAEELEKLAKSLNLPFFTERASPGKTTEEEARYKRYDFFKRVYEQGSYQALLLAHHQDDQAETILKRLLEGAHLSNLKGMQLESQIEGMRILRPLLAFSKTELQLVKGIQDATNSDTRYLRARMRQELFPELNRLFGKNVQNSLIRLGRYAEEIEEFFQSTPYSTLCGPFGLLVEDLPVQRAPLRYVLHKVLREEGLHLSEPLLNQMMEKILKGAANCQLHPRVFLDRGRLFIVKDEIPRYNPKWVVKRTEGPEVCAGGWRALWQGKAELSLPSVDYQLIPPSPCPEMINRLWTAKKVPAFLRGVLPLVTDGQRVIGEFLTGQKLPGDCKFNISIDFVSK